MRLPPLRYLSARDVTAAMPDVAERIALAERTMVALVSDAELPPKLGVHPGQAGSFAHAMPALLRGGDGEGLLGLKWVAGFPDNNTRGLPAITATVIVNDPTSGLASAVLDGGPITAQRTAAVSGVAIGRFAKAGPVRAAILGAGAQGFSHLPVLGHLRPGVELDVFDRHPDRATALAEAARATPGIGSVTVAESARDAVRDADIVITAVSFTTPEARQVMTSDWLADDALVVPVDYATMCAASVARDAALFVVDDRPQFLATRDAGDFDGYPDPTATLGEAILEGLPRPGSGRTVATHLGVGLADVVFADAIVSRAAELGLGALLDR